MHHFEHQRPSLMADLKLRSRTLPPLIRLELQKLAFQLDRFVISKLSVRAL